ncbi:MAG: hypothetical protein N2444_03645 [Methylocystis sp.]|nr:hypothetical protein [Methylocystis sp.]
MKKFVLSAAAFSALAISSTSAFAICIAQGEVTKVTLNPGLPTQIWIRPSNSNANTVNFMSLDVRVTSAAVAAQGSHERVRVNGDATQCSAPSLGLQQGGDVTQFVVAPEP